MSPSTSRIQSSSRPEDAALKIGMLVIQREAIVPEVWRVADLEGSVATLQPVTLGATRQQVPVGDLRRYRIKTTDQVLRGEELVHVQRLLNPRDAEIFQYEVTTGNGRSDIVREIELSVQVESQAPDPVAQMQNLDGSPAALARARTEFLHAFFDATRRSLGIVGYNGARMLPIPHQVSAARYVLLFGRTRFLLADEVGLGKTVEAGLIVSTLRKYFPAWKTAVFVPESLTVQWAFEMYGKFGKTIFRLNEEDAIDDEDEDDDPGMILPHARCEAWARRKTAPEILVIDEAHQVLRNDAWYAALLNMSRRAHAVLLLTATPTSDDGSNLLKLLRLADPDVFERIESVAALEHLLDRKEQVETLLKGLRDHTTSGAAIRKMWDAVEVEDEELTARMLSLVVDSTDVPVRHKIAAMVTDRYDPRARILRYQRKFLAMDNEMAERVEEPVAYKPGRSEKLAVELLGEWLNLAKRQGHAEDPDWQDAAMVLAQAVHSSPLALETWLDAREGKLAELERVTADPIMRRRELLESLERLDGEDDLLARLRKVCGQWTREVRAVDMKGRALARMPRYETLFKQLQSMIDNADDPQRVIIFTSFEANVKPLYLLLNKALGDDVEVASISADMEWRDRERNAFSFQECRGSCVLISDELGGEGRNFQFADALFHFDLPYPAWMVEQRVGRLDRVGRASDLDVDSQVLVCDGGLDEALYEFHREAFGVFNESIAPVEDRVEDVTRRVVEAMIVGGAEAIRELAEPIREELESRREHEMRGLMTRSQTGVEDVTRLIPLLHDEMELERLGRATVTYTRLLGSVVDDQNGRTTITVGSHHPLHSYTGVLSEMMGYFHRAEAVRHERLEFFSAGHPFVRSMARLALQESTDRVAFIQRNGITRPGFLFSVRIAIPQGFLGAIRDLPEDVQPALFCGAAGNFPTRMVRVPISFEGALIEDLTEIAGLEAPVTRADKSLDEGRGILELLPEDWPVVCERAAQAALDEARRQATELFAAGLEPFEVVLAEVLTRHFGPDFAIDTQTETLLLELEPLSVELDSVAVLFPGG